MDFKDLPSQESIDTELEGIYKESETLSEYFLKRAEYLWCLMSQGLPFCGYCLMPLVKEQGIKKVKRYTVITHSEEIIIVHSSCADKMKGRFL